MHLMENLGIHRICRLMEKCAYPQYLDACAIIVQRLFNALAKLNHQKEMKPDPEVCEGKLQNAISVNSFHLLMSCSHLHSSIASF